MRYSTDNLQTSLTLNLAAFLRTRGYASLWYTSGETEAQTGPLLGTITFVPEFPSQPTPFVRLRGETGSQDEIVVPALTLQMSRTPRRKRILGLGHRDYEWEVDLQVDAFAANEQQQRHLQACLNDWLTREAEQPLPVSDYGVDPLNPTTLDPVHVTYADVWRDELGMENAAVRYHIRADATVQFVE